MSKPAWVTLPEVRALVREAEKSLGEGSRVLLRYSGTEPLARIMIEGPEESALRSHASVLEEAIQEFPGCMVVVSHDRYFLDRICTKILDLANYEAGKYLDGV